MLVGSSFGGINCIRFKRAKNLIVPHAHAAPRCGSFPEPPSACVAPPSAVTFSAAFTRPIPAQRHGSASVVQIKALHWNSYKAPSSQLEDKISFQNLCLKDPMLRIPVSVIMTYSISNSFYRKLYSSS